MTQLPGGFRYTGMRYLPWFLASWFLLGGAAWGRLIHDPAGFRVDLPDGWRAASTGAGKILVTSPDNRASVFLRPVLGRTADCAGTLEQTLRASGAEFPQVADLRVSRPGQRLAVARFTFRFGQSAAAVLCAETGRDIGMLYGISAPAADFNRELPRLMAVLRSVAFEDKAPPAGILRTDDPLPLLNVWREPQEMAYTIGVPQGWRASGGIRRLDVTHYNSGVEMSSPDGSVIRIGDQNYGQCTVPGPGMASMPPANGTMQFCAYQSGAQYGDMYVRRNLAREWGLSSVEILSATDRPDLAQRADAVPASMGLSVRSSVAEIRIRARRNGAPVAGAVLARTTFFRSTPGQNFLLGTLSFDSQSFLGNPERFTMLARLTGAVQSSMRIDPRWWSETQRINREVAERTLATMRAQAENQQQAFWDRMAASDRRREAVNDILGGTVRVTDGKGNQYQAKAGSNYYFRDEEAARRASRPEDAVTGRDVWPSRSVDLTPLEVIR